MVFYQSLYIPLIVYLPNFTAIITRCSSTKVAHTVRGDILQPPQVVPVSNLSTKVTKVVVTFFVFPLPFLSVMLVFLSLKYVCQSKTTVRLTFFLPCVAAFFSNVGVLPCCWQNLIIARFSSLTPFVTLVCICRTLTYLLTASFFWRSPAASSNAEKSSFPWFWQKPLFHKQSNSCISS